MLNKLFVILFVCLQAFSASKKVINSDVKITGETAVGTRLKVGTSSATNTYVGLEIPTGAGTSISGASQFGMINQPNFASATTEADVYYGQLRTSGAAYTMALGTVYRAPLASKNAADNITRLINFYGETQVAAANNAFIADNASFSGEYFINQSGTTASVFGGTIRGPDGSAAAPSFALSTATSTGWYKDTVLGGMSLSILGTRRMNVAAGYTFLITPQVFFEDGDATLPSIAFNNDSNTGWFRISSGRVGLTLDGVAPLDISAHSLVFGGNSTGSRNMYIENTNSGAGAHAFLLALTNTNGDPFLRLSNGVIERSIGIDSSDSGTFKIVNSGAGPSGGTTHFSLTTAGLFTLGDGTTNVNRINGATEASGAVTPTFTNFPTGATGNPDVFIKINYNGTDYVIPAWTP